MNCPLTKREIRVLEVLGDGQDMQTVAFNLGLSGVNSDEFFRAICQKTQSRTLMAAAMRAVAMGWVTVQEPPPLQKPTIPNPLTDLEKEALNYARLHMTAPEAGACMGRTPSAIQNLWYSARKKVTPDGNITLIAANLAYEWGWLDN